MGRLCGVLTKEAPIEELGFATRLKAEPFVEVTAKTFVPIGDGVTAAERGFRLDRELNNVLVRSIERGRLVCDLECFGGVTELESESANPLEEAQAERGQS